MSSKLGLILSMFFVVAFFLLGGDLLCLSTAYSNLDSVGVSISYSISKSGRVDKEYINNLEQYYKVTFLNISPSNPVHGDIVDFVISREYNPIVISTTAITLKTSRSAVIGYYG